jgi:hypothetical protein
MKYTKPEIAASKSAPDVIATVELSKDHIIAPDREGASFPLSCAAYEADE